MLQISWVKWKSIGKEQVKAEINFFSDFRKMSYFLGFCPFLASKKTGKNDLNLAIEKCPSVLHLRTYFNVPFKKTTCAYHCHAKGCERGKLWSDYYLLCGYIIIFWLRIKLCCGGKCAFWLWKGASQKSVGVSSRKDEWIFIFCTKRAWTKFSLGIKWLT